MRLGLVDIGTNSIRLDVYAIQSGSNGASRISRIHREKQMVRLGEGVFLKQRLSEAASERTLAVLADFKTQCKSLKVDSVVSLGTCALREATNRQLFLSKASRGLGLSVEVISGREEANLILRGILNDEDTKRNTFGFIDIGGGSTEIGICHHGEAVYLESFALGSARLGQELPVKRPGHPAFQASQVRVWRRHIERLLKRRPLPKGIPAPELVLGSSGTIRALKKIMVRSGNGKKVRRKHLTPLIDRLAELAPESRLRRVPGLTADRNDIILPGAVILDEALAFLGANAVQHTKYSLRDGILERELERLAAA